MHVANQAELKALHKLYVQCYQGRYSWESKNLWGWVKKGIVLGAPRAEERVFVIKVQYHTRKHKTLLTCRIRLPPRSEVCE